MWFSFFGVWVWLSCLWSVVVRVRLRVFRRDAVLAEARDEQRFLHTAQAQLKTTKAQAKAQDAQTKSGLLARMRWAPEFRHTLTDHEKAVAAKLAAERKDFHKMLKTESDKRNAEDLERRRAAGLIWEPVNEAGGDGPAAIFSSRVVWDALVNTTREDGTVQEAWLDNRHVAHLMFFANAVSSSGGGVARIPWTEQTALPHWPVVDNTSYEGVRFRRNDLAHLVKVGFFTVEKEPGFLVVGYGPRTLALIDSYQKALAERGK